MKNINKRLFLIIVPLVFTACSSGSNNSSNVTQNSLITVPTFNYQPGNRTAVMVSIGGGTQTVAEIDTGSQITVVNESAIGDNIVKTTESMQMVYGAGANIVSGYLAYGSVQFTTASGEKLSTAPNTPIMVVTSGSVNQGGGNNVILGMRMDNQVSARLYLPTPYNQMMILNRSESFIAFGTLSTAQLQKFSTINQQPTFCNNFNVPQTMPNKCWDTMESSVTYNYSLTGGGSGSTSYTTIFDSGEPIGNFYLGSGIPSWMNLDGHSITNQLSAVVNTNNGQLPLPLTIPMDYTQPESATSNVVNPGNLLFNTYQILFNQNNGQIGFLAANESW